MPIEFTSYLSEVLPPERYVTSVRVLVFNGDSILVLQNEDSTHIVPGGRLEAGESFEQALRREVLEESGWTFSEPRLLGFIHFHHLAPKPDDYPYPHPDFIQLVFRAEGVEYHPQARLADDYEFVSGFRAISEIPSMTLTSSERLFFEEALKQRNTVCDR